jgi:hypothetical protein
VVVVQVALLLAGRGQQELQTQAAVAVVVRLAAALILAQQAVLELLFCLCQQQIIQAQLQARQQSPLAAQIRF